ncbi:unnamed protein product [Allacma fusca]|uniref:Chitin-binding type-2 domain-containing protein n=1 Tax=Allacma fusca TaxID=39272 RepID=A0A8J2P8V9_9HEXA|nr:unnamed protein product [Allacma fusca]
MWKNCSVVLSALIVWALSWPLQARACSPPYFYSLFTGANENGQINTSTTKLVEKEVIGSLLNGLLELEIELTPGFQCPQEQGVFRDRFDCSTYYECSEWKFVETHCQRDFAFNAQQQRCVPREDANCDLGPVDTNYNCSTSNGLEPNLMNCYRFYLCIGNKAFSQKCDEGKKFDKFFKICLDEKKASCSGP